MLNLIRRAIKRSPTFHLSFSVLLFLSVFWVYGWLFDYLPQALWISLFPAVIVTVMSRRRMKDEDG